MLIYNVSFELASAAFLVMLYIYMRLQYSHQSQTNKEFQRLTLCMLTANVTDVISAVTLSYANMMPRWVNHVTNSLYFLSVIFVGYQFTIYARSCVSRKEKEVCKEQADSNKKADYVALLNKLLMVVFSLIILTNVRTGLIFSMGENGEYIHGIIYYSMYILSFYFIASAGYIMFKSHKLFEKKQMVSVLIYLVVASIGPIMQLLFFQDVLLSTFSPALGLVMLLFFMETPDYQKLVKTLHELEIAQKEAEEANQVKSRFLSNMSHEVRTPVNAILGYNEMIIKEAYDGEIKEYALNVQAAGKMLLSMFDDILDLSDMNWESLTLCKEPYKTESFLRDIITNAFWGTEKKHLRLELDIDEKIPQKLTGDMARLMQIMHNLISNAIKYTEKGYVSIHVNWEQIDAYKGTFYVKIEDSGIGIRKEHLTTLVGYFPCANEEINRNAQGIGLGLCIVNNLLKLMDSKLEVISEYGKGSVFSFEVQQLIADNTPIGIVDWRKHVVSLPLDKSIGEEQGETHTHEGKEHICDLVEEYRNSRLLIVDDDPMNLRLAKKTLERNFEVFVAKSGKEAFVMLKKHQPDLIMLDIHMPDMSGFEILKKIQSNKKYSDVPVIFLTADEDMDAEVRSFEAGAFDFIRKPLVEDVVIHRVGRILELNHLQKNLKQEVEKQTKNAMERHEKVERISFQTMETLASTIDAKDKYTNGHSVRVAEYSREIAKRVGKTVKEQESIYYAALLHDIGKIGIPDEIINKTSKLTDEEYDIIKAHPTIGADILENISELPEIAIGAHWHHERYDGKGYPDHLKGEEIPEIARIIGVADAYDAMTSNRSYRNILEQKKVRDEIEKGKEVQFDPVFADKMLEMIDEDIDYRLQERKNGRKQS